jgi:predicted DNA-binding antitoxin AbrB/MazE fold protein
MVLGGALLKWPLSPIPLKFGDHVRIAFIKKKKIFEMKKSSGSKGRSLEKFWEPS